jgi:predicted branched-subunit amino acid permease
VHVSPQQYAAFRSGVATFGKFIFPLFTWGLVTGVAMAKLPLSLTEIIAMSLVVFAGSAQLAVIPVIAGGFPLWTIFLTAAIINIRFVIFSAAIQPHFKQYPLWARAMLGYLNGDISQVLFMKRFPEVKSDPTSLPFYLGLSVVNFVVWHGSSLIGIYFASFVPKDWGLSFAGNLALVAVVIPLLDRRSSCLAGLAAAMVALSTVQVPLRLNLVFSVLAAVVCGVWFDRASSFESKTRES